MYIETCQMIFVSIPRKIEETSNNQDVMEVFYMFVSRKCYLDNHIPTEVSNAIMGYAYSDS